MSPGKRDTNGSIRQPRNNMKKYQNINLQYKYITLKTNLQS